MMAGRSTFPGFDTPGASFDEPFEMLGGCHERVERTLALLERLVPYLRERGADQVAANAANDVMRYFDLAAPLHHEDEERHVFPVLLRGENEELKAAVLRLQADHRAMTAAWGVLRDLLRAVTANPPQADVEALSSACARFTALYSEHIETENNLVFPAARALLSPQQVAAMGLDMQQRRGVRKS